MSENKHTPGPWTIKVIEPRFNELRDDMEARIEAPLKLNGEGKSGMFYNVATLSFVDMKQSRYHILRNEGVANARLIAEAPNLLEACKTAIAFLEPHTMAHEKLRVAIAKAEGSDAL